MPSCISPHSFLLLLFIFLSQSFVSTYEINKYLSFTADTAKNYSEFQWFTEGSSSISKQGIKMSPRIRNRTGFAYAYQPIRGSEWEINIHFNVTGEPTEGQLDDPSCFMIELSSEKPNKIQFLEEIPEPHTLLIRGISLAFVTNSYKNETGNQDYLIVKYSSKEKHKHFYYFLNPTKPRDKVFNTAIKGFQKGIFLKIQGNLSPGKNFLKIFNYNWQNRSYTEVYRILNASKYLPGETYMKLRGFTGQKSAAMTDILSMHIKEKVPAEEKEGESKPMKEVIQESQSFCLANVTKQQENMEYLLDLLNMNSIELRQISKNLNEGLKEKTQINSIYEHLKKMTSNYQYMTESLETVRGKILLNFQQQRSLAKLAELSLNENNKNFYTLIKSFENVKSRLSGLNFEGESQNPFSAEQVKRFNERIDRIFDEFVQKEDSQLQRVRLGEKGVDNLRRLIDSRKNTGISGLEYLTMIMIISAFCLLLAVYLGAENPQQTRKIRYV